MFKRAYELPPWIPTRYLQPAPVLDDEQWKIFDGLIENLGSQFGIFAGSSISAFINPKEPFIESCPTLRDLVYTGSLVFAITSAQSDGIPILFVAQNRHDADLLSETDVRCFPWNPDLDASEWITKIVNTAKNLGPKLQSKILRKPHNRYEKSIADFIRNNHLADYNFPKLEESSYKSELRARQPRLLAEVALQRLIPAAMAEEFKSNEDLKRLNLDLLIHGHQPNIPILALEIDGKHHLTPEQQNKDEKKNALLKKLGIPLIRTYPHDTDSFNPEKSDTEIFQCYRNAYATLAGLLVSSTKRELQNALKLDPLERKLEQLRHSLSISLYGKSYHDLIRDNPTPNQLNTIDELIENNAIYDQWLGEIQLQEFDWENWINNMTRIWPTHKHYPPPKIKYEKPYWTAHAVITRRSQAKECIPFPKFLVVSESNSEKYWEPIITSTFYEFAQKWIEMNE